MPIPGLESRTLEIGRIRIGVYDDEAGHPEKLETFRLTSSNLDAINAAAKLYGGVVGEKSKVGYDLVTETAELTVMVPPNSFTQWFEHWGRGGVLRRCDGITELIGDTPCLCEVEENRVCVPRSNLRVVMPQIPGLGVWRLATQGWTAARELKGSVEMIEAFAHKGEHPTAELVLEQREKKVQGEKHPRKYAVPVLRLPYTLQELSAPENSRTLGSGAVVRVDTHTGEINPVSSPDLHRVSGETPAELSSSSAGEQSPTTSAGVAVGDGGDGVDSDPPSPPNVPGGEPARARAEKAGRGAEPPGQASGGEPRVSGKGARKPPEDNAGAGDPHVPPSGASKSPAPRTYPKTVAECKHLNGVDVDSACLDCGLVLIEVKP